MTATPSPDFIDPVRRDAVRRLLHDTVQDQAHAAPAVRRRRVMRFAALAAAVVVLGGGGLAYASLTSRTPGGGTAVAPPVTSAPAPSSSPSEAPDPVAGPEATSEPAGTSTPLPAPTPTPTQYSQSDTGSWVVSFDGIGPLGMGHSQKADAALLSAWRQVVSPTCRVRDFQDDGFGPNFATSSTDQAPDITNYVRVGDGFDASQDPQDLAALSPRTASGVRIGSTLAALRAAYPNAVHVGTGPNPSVGTLDYWSVSNGQGRFIDFGLGTDSQVATITVTVTALPPDERASCG